MPNQYDLLKIETQNFPSGPLTYILVPRHFGALQKDNPPMLYKCNEPNIFFYHVGNMPDI